MKRCYDDASNPASQDQCCGPAASTAIQLGSCCASEDAHPSDTCCTSTSVEAVVPSPAAERGSKGTMFRIAAMDCASEESEIRRALEPVSGIRGLGFQLGARTLTIDAPDEVIPQAVAAIRKAGFDPQSVATAASNDVPGQEHVAEGLGRMGLALGFAITAEAVAFFSANTLVFKGLGMALAASAIWLAGFSTYRKGFAALLQGRLNINALMTVAVTGAFLIGQWPEAAMVMALYAIAELIESRAVDRARNAIKSLLDRSHARDGGCASA